MTTFFEEATQRQQEHMSQKFEDLSWAQEIVVMVVVAQVGL
jgi:hypothetical protein